MNQSLLLAGATFVAGGLLALVVACQASMAGAAAPSEPKEFEGFSNDLSFDKAVADALKKAWDDLSKSPDFPKADGMVRFKVTEIAGERGGFAGFNRIRVKIAASM